jgi:hypothetical protein
MDKNESVSPSIQAGIGVNLNKIFGKKQNICIFAIHLFLDFILDFVFVSLSHSF